MTRLLLLTQSWAKICQGARGQDCTEMEKKTKNKSQELARKNGTKLQNFVLRGYNWAHKVEQKISKTPVGRIALKMGKRTRKTKELKNLFNIFPSRK